MKEELQRYAEVIENADLKEYTTLHTKAICAYLLFPESISHLQELLIYLNEKAKNYFVLGNGSDVILNENIQDIIFIKLSKIKAIDIHKEYNLVYAEAGANVKDIVPLAVEQGLAGLEFAINLEETVGAAIYHNAYAYNTSILDYVKSVTVITKEGVVQTIEHEDLKYAYKKTEFQENKETVIVAAKFYLKNGDIEKSREMVEARKQEVKKENAKGYLQHVFANQENDDIRELIVQCGCEGSRIKDAKLATAGNTILNIGNATGNDVKSLIEFICKQVYEKTSVTLQVEKEYIGWE